MEAFFNNVLEGFYILTGLQLLYTAYKVFNDSTNPRRVGSGLFWLFIGILFTLGSYIPNVINGILVVAIGLLTLFKQVTIGKLPAHNHVKAESEAKRLSGLIFIPLALLALSAVVIAQLFPASSKSVIGISSVIATLVAMVVFRSNGKEVLKESNRMVQQVGTTGILPQLLGALGVIFTMAGVGDVIAKMISGVVPDGNILAGVIAYVLGMVIFTMIMGNAFAAFTVITVGIGLPFVFAQGGDPAIASALAMTAGFCGTLLTPMAGNFNALPVALLEMKNPYSVIKAQAPTALLMIVVHIVLMYVLAF